MNVRIACVAVLSLAVASCSAGDTDGKNGLSLGLRVSDDATAADAGLPHYPGAKPYQDQGSSESAANLDISTPLFGLKVVAMNLESGDDPQRVARFYQKAMAKYGKVLECTEDTSDRTSRETDTHSTDSDSNELKCDFDDPGSHGVVYKVGTEDNQRIVAIKPHGGGTRFSVAHVDVRDEGKD
jgi:hypothetical protein